jgi:hypothetical protein
MTTEAYEAQVKFLRAKMEEAPSGVPRTQASMALQKFKKAHPDKKYDPDSAEVVTPAPSTTRKAAITSARKAATITTDFYAFAEKADDDSLKTWMRVESLIPDDEENFTGYEGMEEITEVYGPELPFGVVDLHRFMAQPKVVKTHMANNDPPSDEAISLGRKMLKLYKKDDKTGPEDLKQLGKLFTLMGTNSLDSIVLAEPPLVEAVEKYEDNRGRTSLYNFVAPPVPQVIKAGYVQCGSSHLIKPQDDGFTVHEFAVRGNELVVEAECDSALTAEKRWLSFCHSATKLTRTPNFFVGLPTDLRQWIMDLYKSVMAIEKHTPYVDMGPNIAFVMPEDFMDNITKVTAALREVAFKEFLSLPHITADDLAGYRKYRKDIPAFFKDMRDPTGNVLQNEGVSVCAKWQQSKEVAQCVLGAEIDFCTIGHSDQNRWKYVFPSSEVTGIEVDLVRHLKELQANKGPMCQRVKETGNVRVLCSDIFIEDTVGAKKDKLNDQVQAHKIYATLLKEGYYDALLVKLHPVSATGSKDKGLTYASLAYYDECKIAVASLDQTRMHNMERIVLIVPNGLTIKGTDILDPLDSDWIGDLSMLASSAASWTNLIRNGRLALGCPFVPPDYCKIEVLENLLGSYVVGPYEGFNFDSIQSEPLRLSEASIDDLCAENTKAEADVGTIKSMSFADMRKDLDARVGVDTAPTFKIKKGTKYQSKASAPGLSANLKTNGGLRVQSASKFKKLSQ